MPSFISQDRVCSLTDRARARTSYLAPVRSLVQRALDERFAEDSTATDFTLAALAAVGQARIRQLARSSARSVDTTKQDVGLLVPQLLIERFGPTRVETYRSDDGSAASQRAVGWPGLQAWVNRYTPHRVVEPRERIILDTAVVREDTLDVEAAERVLDGRLVSIADGAVIELVHWMRMDGARRPAFPGWGYRARRYSRILDPNMPIAPGGHELAALAGLRDFEPSFSPERFRGYSREIWRYLAAATSVADLDRPHTFYLDSQLVTFDVRPTSPVLRDTGDAWTALAVRFGQLLSTADKNAVTPAELRGLFRQSLAADGEIRNVARLELVVAALAKRAYEAAFRGYAPKPGKSNAAVDFALLFGVALPAVVCTSDRNLINFVRQLDVPDRFKVLNPEELLIWLATGKFPSSHGNSPGADI